MAQSLFEQLKDLPANQATQHLESLPKEALDDLSTSPWWFIGRPEQQEPEGNWNIWLILAGRGWGKSRTGAQWIVDQALNHPKAPDLAPTEWAIIAETFSDARKICVEGASGVIRVLKNMRLVEGFDYEYNKSLWQIIFKDGQKIHLFGADNPDAGRGLNLSGIWADEIAKWRYPYATWYEGIAPALRIGEKPRACITTTPNPSHFCVSGLAAQMGQSLSLAVRPLTTQQTSHLLHCLNCKRDMLERASADRNYLGNT